MFSIQKNSKSNNLLEAELLFAGRYNHILIVPIYMKYLLLRWSRVHLHGKFNSASDKVLKS